MAGNVVGRWTDDLSNRPFRTNRTGKSMLPKRLRINPTQYRQDEIYNEALAIVVLVNELAAF
jgi:hypothetical protein